MVSLWPWKGDDSPASFEKALSALATKITNSQQRLSLLQQRGRRLRTIWTLYTSFGYLLCIILLFFVVGFNNWGITEYTTALGGPVLFVFPTGMLFDANISAWVRIYAGREIITVYYTFRVDKATQRLRDQQRERAKTIDRLKDATRYNSTQQLLDKYGETPARASSKPKSQAVPQTPSKPPPPQHLPERTQMPPPPTANIQRSLPTSPAPISARRASQGHDVSGMQNRTPQPPPYQASMAEFAPNAFGPAQQTHGRDASSQERWYDRILDVLLGEDETLPKNRIVLICRQCRLVNGQAPPGVKDLAELGQWRCSGCGSLNGEEDEAAKMVNELKRREADADIEEPELGESAPEVTGASRDNSPPAIAGEGDANMQSE